MTPPRRNRRWLWALALLLCALFFFLSPIVIRL
jgi:hypothetical protein